MAPRLAYLGMGSMGQAMSKNLVANGNLSSPLLLWNRTPSKALQHAEKIGNAKHAKTVADAIQSADIIWTCLASQEAVLETFETILKEDVKGKVFIDASTITPDATNELAKRIEEKGAELVACPVFGEPSMANAAMLTAVPAGKKEAVEKILPYLKGVIARAVIDLSGEEPGKASHLKVIGNVLIVQMIEAVAEAHVLAEKTGLNNALMDSAIAALFPGPMAIYSKKMVTGAYHKAEPMVHIDMAIKVASHVLGLAEKSGAQLPGYQTGAKHIEKVKEHVGAEGDIAGIYGAVRLESGLPYHN